MYKITKSRVDDMLGILDLLLSVDGDSDNLKPEEFLVAKNANDSLLGCGRLKHYSNQCIELASIAVYPEHRKIGVASNIIQNLVESTKEKIYLVCDRPLIPFFEKFYFKIYDGLVHQDMWNKYQDTFNLFKHMPAVMVRPKHDGH